jgi:broad specificity phosphatase PhoE
VSRVVLVRHGQAAAGWDSHPDPGLSEVGRAQAEAVASDLFADLAPRALLTSPLRRTRETAAPLEVAWGLTARVEPGVGEIVSPTEDLSERTAWLRRIMVGDWAAAGADLRLWRQGVLDTLTRLVGDTVVFTHFVAINVAVGAATGDPRVTCFLPDNCSRTILDVVDGGLRLLALGAEAHTTVR